MSDEPDLVAAFFDEPGLLAVRFQKQATATQPEARFTLDRKPDVQRGGCLKGCVGFIISLGAFALLVTLVTASFSQCSSRGGGIPAPAITVDDASPTDCRQGSSWPAGLTELAETFQPVREDLRPWHLRTLLDVPKELARRGEANGGWLVPCCGAKDREAFRLGQHLATLLEAAGCRAGTGIILDLPGSQSAAMAAGLATRFDPVIAIDNLPHPRGVVDAAQTLASLVYWRPEYIAGRAPRSIDAPPVFVLEGDRLTPYRNEVDRFDNRSVARLPDAAGFKQIRVERVLYVREKRAQIAEADDLNDHFIALGQAGISVRHLSLEALAAAVQPAGAVEAPSPAALARWFQANYGWNRPEDVTAADPPDADAAYRTTARLTIFDQGVARTALDGGHRHQATIMPLLMPRSSGASTSTGSTHHRSTHSTYRPSTTTHRSSGGSWSRSSSRSSG